MIQFEKIAKEVADSMKFTITVESFTDNGDGTFTIGTCYTGPLTKYAVFSVGDDKYQVKDFSFNESLTIQPEGDAPNLESDFMVKNPIFKHGTIYETTQDLSNHSRDVSPLIYLYERLQISENDDPLDRARYTLSPAFYILLNFEDHELTEQSYEKLIRPARNIATEFKKRMKAYTQVLNNPFSASSIAISKFGTTNFNGVVNNYLSKNYAGVELVFDLSLKDSCKTYRAPNTSGKACKTGNPSPKGYCFSIQPDEINSITIPENHHLIVSDPVITGSPVIDGRLVIV